MMRVLWLTMLMIMLSRRRIFDDGEAKGDGCGVPQKLVLDLGLNSAQK